VIDAHKSYQQLDPVGGYSTRPVTLLGCAAIVIYVASETLFGWSGVGQPGFGYSALAVILVAGLGVVYWSSPLRAPFPRAGFVAVVALALAGMGLAAAASWTGLNVPPGEWGPVVFGLLMVASSPYRPPRELAIATVVGGLGAGVIAVLHPATHASVAPVVVTLVATVVPLVCLGFGASAYASALRRSLGPLQSGADRAARAASDELRADIVRSVQLNRVGILNGTVVPYFAGLLRRDTVTIEDGREARDISVSIRTLMVADVERSWLDHLVDEIARARDDGSLPGSEAIQDADRLASEMTTEQRVMMRVLLVALFAQPGFDPDGFAILFTPAGDSCEVTITAKLDYDESIQRSGLAAHFAVLRIVFGDLNVAFQPPTLRLRFSYEHR
jgi:hypothetical protein